MASVWKADNSSVHGADVYRSVSVNAYEQIQQGDMLPYGGPSAQEALSCFGPNASTETCDMSDFIHSTT